MNNIDLAYLSTPISGCMLVLLSFDYRSEFDLFMQPFSYARVCGQDVLSVALALQNLS